MSTATKKKRKRNREQFLDGIGKATYEAFMDKVQAGEEQPRWEDVPKESRVPWMAAGDGAMQEFFRGWAGDKQSEN